MKRKQTFVDGAPEWKVFNEEKQKEYLFVSTLLPRPEEGVENQPIHEKTSAWEHDDKKQASTAKRKGKGLLEFSKKVHTQFYEAKASGGRYRTEIDKSPCTKVVKNQPMGKNRKKKVGVKIKKAANA